MSLNITQKKTIVAKFQKINKSAISIVIVNFTSVNVNNLTILRKKCRENNVIIHVIKNSLLKLIIQNSAFKSLENKICGSILVGYSFKHPGTAARLFKDFSNKYNNFKIKAAVFNNKLYDNIDILANLPTYSEAICFLLKTIKFITIERLVYVLIMIKNKK
ncbi:50S ribosomal protein L10 [Enterobacteriaceae endosymbiont of Macroplea mutica]|uniref:50S ribosomal protein L10 n=1 Tax=Enterobacteriaceae endosymbiont of Macroplea mutica TaxID=2675791 RepID=UPI001449003F|nr:50S ribosomal protein L10 [Enterobacteriaceae endosymbiont of Macroplea mutica]QJC31336.1 50S ribosomal protein L10 [Enterobacteriaceae endosymbiont of Macroplea mutica]